MNLPLIVEGVLPTGENEVAVEYVCGGQFYGDADITAYMDTWYSEKGVEVVFACGGGIYTSAAEAAIKVGGKVIGVDSDQSFVINEFLNNSLPKVGPTELDEIKSAFEY